MTTSKLSSSSNPATLGARRKWARQLAWFAVPFLGLTLLSVASAVQDVHQHRALDGMHALFPGLIEGRDLSGFRERFQFYGSLQFFRSDAQYFGDLQSFNYAATLAVVARVLFSLPMDAVMVSRAILLFWLLLLGTIFVRACRQRGAGVVLPAAFAAAVLGLSVPVVLLVCTANLEVFVWLATGVGVWSWFTHRENTAAGCFGLAASMKYFPLAFLVLFLSRERWRALAISVAVFVGASLAGLWMLGPTVMAAGHGLQNEMARFGQHYLLHWQRNDNGYDHSLYGVLKLVLVASGHEAALPEALRLYLPAIALFLPVLYFWRIRSLDPLDQVIALAVLSIWVTPMSQDYTLVHLLVPCGCLLLARLSEGWQRGDAARLACFGAVFSTLTFVQLGPARLGGNLKALALGVLLALTLRKKTPRTHPPLAPSPHENGRRLPSHPTHAR